MAFQMGSLYHHFPAFIPMKMTFLILSSKISLSPVEGYAQIYLPGTVLEIVLKNLASHLPVAISGSGVSLQIDATYTTES